MKGKFVFAFIVILAAIGVLSYYEYEGITMPREEFHTLATNVSGIGEVLSERLYDEIIVKENMVRKVSPIIPIAKSVIMLSSGFIVGIFVSFNSKEQHIKTRSRVDDVNRVVVAGIEVGDCDV